MREILQEAIDRYGTESQLMMVLEEMSELQKEICKWFRGKRDRDAIADEVADVEITLAQLKMIFDIDRVVYDHKEQKVKRLYNRLREPVEGVTVEIPLFYDKEAVYENCTVQILRNTLTGEQSICWRPNSEPPKEET